MGENSKIAWTDHTFNPWWGCAKVSSECANCYAETLARRFGFGWGEFAEPRFFGAKHWAEPLRWNRDAEKSGKRAKVFCGSMCDVFEGREVFKLHRDRLWELIFKTPMLDWLLLTKRPENFARLHAPVMANIWKGATAGTQRALDERVQHLAATHGVRFLSMEPLIEPVSLRWLAAFPENAPYIAQNREGSTNEYDGLRRIDWVIVGAESGQHARPCDVAWIRSIVGECKAAGVPVFVKQMAIDGVLTDNPEFFPADLRVREFPKE